MSVTDQSVDRGYSLNSVSKNLLGLLNEQIEIAQASSAKGNAISEDRAAALLRLAQATVTLTSPYRAKETRPA